MRRSNVNGLDESELVKLALSNHPAAYEELLRRHQKLVYNMLMQMVRSPEQAADLTQEAFMRAYKSLSTFRPDAKFKPWILKIASNVCLNHIRDRKDTESLDRLLEENPLAEPTANDNVEQQAELRLTQALLQAALHELTARQRQAFVLRYVHDLSYDEISTVLDVPVSTVKPLLFRIRERLKKLLSKQVSSNIESNPRRE